MKKRLLIVDDFSPRAHELRAEGLAAPFIDWKGPDGQVYKRICLRHMPDVQECLERRIGPVKMHAMGYRLNYDGELPNAAIHSDLGWGTHALVLYLCDGPGGTAFWRHNATGLESIKAGQVAEWEAVRDDWNRLGAWEQRELAELKFNRAAIYDGSQFHSRWPFEAFGIGPEDGRLVAVAFFTPGTE